MRQAVVWATALLCGVLIGNDRAAVNKRHAELAIGGVKITQVDFAARWHSYLFVAREGCVAPYGGGFMRHRRLDADGVETVREERVRLRYVQVDGDETWLAGPVTRDSNNEDPTRWFVVKVADGGKPRAQGDSLWWTRVETEAEARDYVENKMTPPVAGDVMSGDIRVLSR